MVGGRGWGEGRRGWLGEGSRERGGGGGGGGGGGQGGREKRGQLNDT